MYVSAMSHCYSWFPGYLTRHLLSLPKILHQRWSDLLKLSTPRKIVNRSILTLTRCQGGQNNSKQKQLTNWEWQFQQFFTNSETSGTKFWTTNWQHVSLISPIMKGSDTKIRFNFMETEFPFHMNLEIIKCWCATQAKRIIRYWISLHKHLETKIYNKQYTIQLNKSQWGWRRRLCFTLHTLCWLPVWAVWNSFESIRAFEWVITLWAAGG